MSVVSVVNPFVFAGFDPASIPDMFLWLEADSGALSSGVPATDGDPVTTWEDKSVNGNDVDGLGGNEPSFVASGLNGHPSIYIGPASEYFLQANVNLSSSMEGDCSMYALYNYDATYFGSQPTQCLISKRLSTASEIPSLFKSSTTRRVIINASISDAVTAVAASTWYRAGYTYDEGAGGLLTHFLSGAADGDDTLGTTTVANSSDLFIGIRADGFKFLGDLVALFFFRRALTAAEMLSLDGYLTAKYGL